MRPPIRSRCREGRTAAQEESQRAHAGTLQISRDCLWWSRKAQLVRNHENLYGSPTPVFAPRPGGKLPRSVSTPRPMVLNAKPAHRVPKLAVRSRYAGVGAYEAGSWLNLRPIYDLEEYQRSWRSGQCSFPTHCRCPSKFCASCSQCLTGSSARLLRPCGAMAVDR
ncbi:hypothetical protein OH76DRAFT_542703 [Lentinus brumalis]|uniref:Uncharacterized protein n=1 Tax=Lentinus brumalis TaxID=2498619 RepID=A0A371D9P5_9APHY|nr:hypothetical protein OH76DRAFT_542703 [Polyporus brumalis]